jgi:hypothetical protein
VVNSAMISNSNSMIEIVISCYTLRGIGTCSMRLVIVISRMQVIAISLMHVLFNSKYSGLGRRANRQLRFKRQGTRQNRPFDHYLRILESSSFAPMLPTIAFFALVGFNNMLACINTSK